ncbi:MAG TPA: septum formation initiator family protein [Candidatus Paceibacterota bacterium]|nr:septum formation initiator family protein [Candidatus Paceibacterota bacterium]HMP19247.1 septum formation initiator family protein [Candidatus Paceibacterota bacterium]HMP85536.1 septum formation initiator family protein [Candidatus Paceibacterota bacterium]
MKEFQKKIIVKKRIYSNFSIILLLIILFLVLNSTYELWKKYKYTKMVLENDERKLSELKDQKNNLEEKIQDLSTEVGVERELRERFYLAKPEENVIFIIDTGTEEILEIEEKNKIEHFFDKFKTLFK